MKYHYFHGRFTYSVKRSGPRAVVLPRGVDCLVWLDSCVEACAVSSGVGRSGGLRWVSLPAMVMASVVLFDCFACQGGSLFCEAIRAEDSVGWGV